jgi:hypothetical protein
MVSWLPSSRKSSRCICRRQLYDRYCVIDSLFSVMILMRLDKLH